MTNTLFDSYQLKNVIGLRGRHFIRMYEILKANQYKGEQQMGKIFNLMALLAIFISLDKIIPSLYSIRMKPLETLLHSDTCK